MASYLSRLEKLKLWEAMWTISNDRLVTDVIADELKANVVKRQNVLDLIAKNDCVYMLVPNNLTNEFQMLDLNIICTQSSFKTRNSKGGMLCR